MRMKSRRRDTPLPLLAAEEAGELLVSLTLDSVSWNAEEEG